MASRPPTTTAGFTLAEMSVAMGIGAIVMLGAMTMVQTGRDGNEFIVTEARAREESDNMRRMIREVITPSSIDRIDIAVLANGETRLILDYCCAHIAGSPVWGVNTAPMGMLYPSSSALAFADLAVGLAPAPGSDDTDALAAEVHPPYRAGWKECYWPLTITLPVVGLRNVLMRSVINAAGLVHSTTMVNDQLVPNDPANPGFQFTKAGDSVRANVNFHPKGMRDRISTSDSFMTPRN